MKKAASFNLFRNIFFLKELNLKLVAFKGIGKDHAKFSPVGNLLKNFL
jgi:hypothetical protein